MRSTFGLKIIYWTTALFLLLNVPSFAGSSVWVEKVMAWTINAQFQKAEDTLHLKIAQTDSALAPCFYLASVLNSKMNFNENQSDASEFEKLLKYIIRRSNRYLKQPAHNDSVLARLYFYRGSAYGYWAYFQGQTGQWFGALKKGLKAVSDLKKAVHLDSTLYEAYLGLGTYKYWRSTKLKFALWLPFVYDQRQEGINDIKRALRSASNSRYMALHQLIYILTDYGKYDEALHYAKEGIAAFPESPFMWWAYAHTYFKAHEYPQAANAYSHLLALIESHPWANRSHWLACQVRLAEIYRRMGQKGNARRIAGLVLEKEKTFSSSSLNKKRIEKAREILRLVGN